MRRVSLLLHASCFLMMGPHHASATHKFPADVNITMHLHKYPPPRRAWIHPIITHDVLFMVRHHEAPGSDVVESECGHWSDCRVEVIQQQRMFRKIIRRLPVGKINIWRKYFMADAARCLSWGVWLDRLCFVSGIIWLSFLLHRFFLSISEVSALFS